MEKFPERQGSCGPEVKKGLIIIMALGLLSSLAVGNAMGQVWGPPQW